MSPLDFVIILALISVGAGLLGSLVGLGGGIIIVPVLTLLFHINIRLAIGASIISVIATSSGAAIAYVKERLTNLKAGMFLEIATTTGAITGAFLTTLLTGRILYVLFAVVLLYSSYSMLSKRKTMISTTSDDKIANYFDLHGSYYDQNEAKEISYKVTRTKLGLIIMYIAGIISALLGVGSGTLKVSALDTAMRMPIKASTATSDFMIGVTAAASAGAYFSRGQIDPFLAAPIVVGILIGAFIGSKMLNNIKPAHIKILFLIVLLVIAAEMIQRGLS